ncbi:HAD family hydrolase [Verrucomicrobiaceae bacterium 227]
MTFLFDIGNVLIGVNFPPFYERIFGTPTPDPAILTPFIALRDLGDTGQISNEDFALRVSELAPDPITPQDVAAAWNDIFFPIEPMWKVVAQLKAAGHRLILFSNTNQLHLDHIRPAFPILAEFPAGHYSCEEGALKPHLPFYTRAIERFSLVPAETCYLDDLPENIATGQALGLNCHQYDLNNHQAALDWLQPFLSPRP